MTDKELLTWVQGVILLESKCCECPATMDELMKMEAVLQDKLGE